MSFIESISFGILSPDEIRKLSVMEVTQSKSHGRDSVNDPRLGVVQNRQKCQSCEGENHKCPGHNSYIELCYPIPNPLFIKDIISYLTCMCEVCKRFIVTKHEAEKLYKFNRMSPFFRFDAISKFVKKTSKVCPYCVLIRPKYKYEEGKFYKIYEKKDEKTRVFSHEIHDLLQHITAEDLSIMGLTNSNHPKNMIITTLPVIPLPARPYVEMNGMTTDDDLTIKYVDIMKNNMRLKNVAVEDMPMSEFLTRLETDVRVLFDNTSKKTRGVNGRPYKSIIDRLDGKAGRIRSNLNGKRVDHCARTVIGPDPLIRADEVIIPAQIANKLVFPEIVSHFNKEWLESLVATHKAISITKKKRDDGKTCFINLSGMDKPVIFLFALESVLRPRDMIKKRGMLFHPREYYMKRGVMYQPDPEKDQIKRDGDLIPFTIFAYEKYDSDIYYKKVDASEAVRGNMGDYLILNADNIVIDGSDCEENVKYSFYKKQYKVLTTLDRGAASHNDLILREGVFYMLKVYQKRVLSVHKLDIGDTVERPLRNGDLIPFNRQPTLHPGSIVTRKARILTENRGGKEIKTFRIPLSSCETYGADFDGDESNIYPALSHETRAECMYLSSTDAQIKSTQSTKLLCTFIQDVVTAAYYFTEKMFVKIPRQIFFDACMSFTDMKYFATNEKITKEIYDQTQEDCLADIILKMEHIHKTYHKLYPELIGAPNYDEYGGYYMPRDDDHAIYNGHTIVSLMLPNYFSYSNFNDDGKPKKLSESSVSSVRIAMGVMTFGILSKKTLSRGFNTLTHHLEKIIGGTLYVSFASNFQIVFNILFRDVGFSCGFSDCTASPDLKKILEEKVKNGLIETSIIESKETSTTENTEKNVTLSLSNILNIGHNTVQQNIPKDNAFRVMVEAGSKGSYTNVSQIFSCVGQQDIDGRRIEETYGGRTLPHYPYKVKRDQIMSGRTDYESKGFVKFSYTHGLNLLEFYKHSQAGRIGIIDSSLKTSKTGYIERKTVKLLENVLFNYSKNVRSVNNNLLQFSYGQNLDPSTFVKVGQDLTFTDIDNHVLTLCDEVENQN